MNLNTRRIALVIAFWALALFAALPSSFAQSTSANRATADLMDAEGKMVGTAAFRTTASGAVEMKVHITDFASAGAGEHGVHIHAVGKCEGPKFTSAGGHFNPTSTKHGLNNPEGPHGGDLPGLMLDADGTANYTATTERVTLGMGMNSLFDADGSALVIHAKPDDQMTDPSGNSGDRIACGFIMLAPEEVGMPRTGDNGALDAMLWVSLLGAALFMLGAAFSALLRRRA